MEVAVSAKIGAATTSALNMKSPTDNPLRTPIRAMFETLQLVSAEETTLYITGEP